MIKLWCVCTNAKGTKTLVEGTKYLIQPIGLKAKVIIDEHNPKNIYGNIVNKDRFKQLPVKQLKPDI